MSNQYSFSLAADFEAMAILIGLVGTEVDSIRDTDLPALDVVIGDGFSATAGAKVSEEITSGAGNWNCHAGVFEIDVILIGGGGSGGSTLTGAGGGGGGGSAVGVFSMKVEPGDDYAYSIGAGGAPAAIGDNDGNNGEPSTFAGIENEGGKFGLKGTVETGGAGGNWDALTGGAGGAAGGNVGENGERPEEFNMRTSGAGGGGGEQPGSGGDGGNTMYGAGGGSTDRGGGGGASWGDGGDGGPAGNTDGVAAGANTGGGGGGASSIIDNKAGGAGGSGYIKITYRI